MSNCVDGACPLDDEPKPSEVKRTPLPEIPFQEGLMVGEDSSNVQGESQILHG